MASFNTTFPNHNLNHYSNIAEKYNRLGATLFGQGDAVQALSYFKKSLKALNKVQDQLSQTVPEQEGECCCHQQRRWKLVSIPYASCQQQQQHLLNNEDQYEFLFTRAMVLVQVDKRHCHQKKKKNSTCSSSSNSDNTVLQHQWSSLSSAVVMFNIALAGHILSLQGHYHSSTTAKKSQDPLKLYSKCIRQWKVITTPLLHVLDDSVAMLISTVSMAALNNMALLWTNKGQMDRAEKACQGILDLIQQMNNNHEYYCESNNVNVDNNNTMMINLDNKQVVNDLMINAVVFQATKGRCAPAA